MGLSGVRHDRLKKTVTVRSESPDQGATSGASRVGEVNQQVVVRPPVGGQSVGPFNEHGTMSVQIIGQSRVIQVPGIFKAIQINVRQGNGAEVFLNHDKGRATDHMGGKPRATGKAADQRRFSGAQLADERNDLALLQTASDG